jgi:hypothetical protein
MYVSNKASRMRQQEARNARANSGNRTARAKGCVAAASWRKRDARDPVSRVWRFLRQSLPQYGARGFGVLMRLQLLTGLAGLPQVAITDTPNPSPDGATFTTPEILPEGDPRLPLRV